MSNWANNSIGFMGGVLMILTPLFISFPIKAQGGIYVLNIMTGSEIFNTKLILK